jgi:hypothetical protein
MSVDKIFDYRWLNLWLPRFHRDERGLETLEWLLLFCAVVLPLAAFILKLAVALGRYYSFVSQVLSLPFL